MYRLIYTSKTTDSLEKEIFRDILYTSGQQNSQNGITGALLATPSHYLQILEGEYDAVNETFGRIALDRRHAQVELIVFREIKERIFNEWSMKGLGLFQLNHELAKSLIEKYGEEDGSLRFPREEKATLALLTEVALLEPGTEQ